MPLAIDIKNTIRLTIQTLNIFAPTNEINIASNGFTELCDLIASIRFFINAFIIPIVLYVSVNGWKKKWITITIAKININPANNLFNHLNSFVLTVVLLLDFTGIIFSLVWL